METIRGANTIIAAWNPAVAGSAVYASIANLPSPMGVTQTSNSICLHAA